MLARGWAATRAGDGVDEADGLLRAVVAGGRLRAEDKHAGLHGEAGIGHDAVVEHQDVQGVEHLPLVLVQALGLDVEHEGGIDHRALAVLQEAGQALLVLQSVPMASQIRLVSSGLQLISQRRWVMPLVMALNFSGMTWL